ncbi:MAG: ABC transporter ATP-binding protein [Acidobacteriota bacterium]|nr:ABC transporter ATP-binding protein [Acidobacteriota bacterium]
MSNLSVAVRRGEVFGFLGPNGAGKSTSIKMLLGLVKPSSGQAFVLGAPSDDVEIRRKIGFLPEDFRFYSWLTATELLHLHGRLFGMGAARLRERVPALLELVGLTPHREKRLRDFSKGMLQRIGLAQALIHEPELVFLDEPTSGLDPMGRRLVRDVIRAERERGATIFLNSHILSEIEITCDRVVFIKEGRVVASHDLRANPEGEVRLAARVRNLSADAIAGLAKWGSGAHLEGERLTLVPRSADGLPEILRHLVASGADVFEYRPEHVSLEDLFLKIMGEDRGL